MTDEREDQGLPLEDWDAETPTETVEAAPDDSFDDEPPELQPASFEAEPERRRSMIPVLLVIGGVLLVGIILLLVLGLGGGGRSTTTATALADINLREGPGVGYPSVGAVLQGTKVKVIGKTEDGTWLQVETPDGKQGWITGLSEYVEVDQKALARVPAAAASQMTYDASSPKVNQVLNEIPLVVYHADHFTCASHGGLNYMLPEVAEGNVIGPHAGDFAYASKEGNVLFKYTGGTFVLIRDNPIARFEGDKESLPLAEALRMFADGEVVWTGDFGRWPARGVPGCDPAAQP
jgi:uncharacterized protein YraI